MNTKSFVYAILPPLLAIAVEKFNPVNEDSLKFKVDSAFDKFPSAFERLLSAPTLSPPLDQAQTGQAEAHYKEKAQYAEEIIRTMKEKANICATAAAEVASIAPTAIGSVLSCFAVVSELQQPLLPAAIYVVFFIALILFIVRFVGKRDLVELAVMRPWISIIKRPFPKTYVESISVFIYIFNIALIGLAAWVFSKTK